MTYFLVPTYRRPDQLIRCLDSVRRTVSDSWQAIVVDDDPERSVMKACVAQESVTVLLGTGNLFWGGSINLAMAYLHSLSPEQSDIVIFANSDVQLRESTYLHTTRRLPESPHLYHPRSVDHNSRSLSAGARLITWIPYVTKHPRTGVIPFAPIQLATARFLAMSYRTLVDIGEIHPRLPQYQGDNEFTLRARRRGHKTFIVADAVCDVDERSTGFKNNNVADFRHLLRSFFSIRSAQNLLYRYRFARSRLCPVLAILCVASLTTNSIVKTGLNRMARGFR